MVTELSELLCDEIKEADIVFRELVRAEFIAEEYDSLLHGINFDGVNGGVGTMYSGLTTSVRYESDTVDEPKYSNLFNKFVEILRKVADNRDLEPLYLVPREVSTGVLELYVGFQKGY